MIKKIFLTSIVLIAAIAIGGYIAIDNNKHAMYQLATDLGAKEAGLVTKQLKVKGHTVHYMENGLKNVSRSKGNNLRKSPFEAFGSVSVQNSKVDKIQKTLKRNQHYTNIEQRVKLHFSAVS